MASQVIASSDFLQQFTMWGDEKRESFLIEFFDLLLIFN